MVSLGGRCALQVKRVCTVVQDVNLNRDRRFLKTDRSWYHWEAIFELNYDYHWNGTMRMWIDGQMVMDYRDVKYVTPEHRVGFNLWKWNPTWGGMGGVRTRVDIMSIDDVRLSGISVEREAEQALQRP